MRGHYSCKLFIEGLRGDFILENLGLQLSRHLLESLAQNLLYWGCFDVFWVDDSLRDVLGSNAARLRGSFKHRVLRVLEDLQASRDRPGQL